MALPAEKDSNSFVISCFMERATSSNSERSANSNSSWSEKSNSSSKREVRCSSLSRNSCRRDVIPPRIWFMAMRCCEALDDAIRSATASACVRSILPLRKARCVNSPGCARRHPFSINSERIVSRIYLEPWQDISIESSPV